MHMLLAYNFSPYILMYIRIRNEIDKQAEELEDMYEKRLEIYRMSVKKDNRKRRRRDEGTYACMLYLHMFIGSCSTVQ